MKHNNKLFIKENLETVVFSGIVTATVSKGIRSTCKCLNCDKSLKDEYRLHIVTPFQKRGFSVCPNCFGKLSVYKKTASRRNPMVSDNTGFHKVTIIAPKFEKAYFSALGYTAVCEGRQALDGMRTFILLDDNAYTSTKTATEAMKHGYLVRVNGVEVHTQEAFLAVLGRKNSNK